MLPALDCTRLEDLQDGKQAMRTDDEVLHLGALPQKRKLCLISASYIEQRRGVI